MEVEAGNSLLFFILQVNNNVVIISGSSLKVIKSFILSNLASVSAQAGQ
jgi:hypothetical protein